VHLGARHSLPRRDQEDSRGRIRRDRSRDGDRLGTGALAPLALLAMLAMLAMLAIKVTV